MVGLMGEPPLHIVAVRPHEGEAADLVRELKYRRATAAVSAMADRMALVSPEADLVSWVPATPKRRRSRGFDQGELLARAVARRLGIQPRRLLRRSDNRAQTARDRKGRMEGPRLHPVGRQLRLAPTVLLVDDVCTTGATLAAAAAVLRHRGAGVVVALVFTRVEFSPRAHYQHLASTIGGRTKDGGCEWTSPSAHGMRTSRRDWRR